MSIREVYDAFCKNRYPLCTEKDIEQFESRLSAHLPADFRQYLLEFNRGFFINNKPMIVPPDEDAPKAVLDTMYGVNAPLEYAQINHQANLHFADDYIPGTPVEILPIGNTDFNYMILLDLGIEQNGQIYLRTFSDSFWLAEGIEDFFNLIVANPFLTEE